MSTETTPSRLPAKYVAEMIALAGPDLCVATPCGILAPLLGELAGVHRNFGYVHREDNAVALAAGVAMAGRRAVVLMQNSGLGQSVNVLASLVEPFRPPIGLVISLRGTGQDTTRENRSMGHITEPLLDHFDIPWRPIGRQSLEWFDDCLESRTGPAALLVPPEFFGWSASK
ncbi:MAG TPA: hypothetical protein VG317_21385 [Pseudonocardiaceae bacterium]|nr:hypothetical protein [Pseudonocardiaceae bacterium]